MKHLNKKQTGNPEFAPLPLRRRLGVSVFQTSVGSRQQARQFIASELEALHQQIYGK
jgi:hypothetical protein